MMKRLMTLALAAITFAAAPQALKAQDEDALCPLGNATARGTYISHATGYVVGVGPIATVGVMTFDGKGTGLLNSTASVNGGISQGKLSATYTLKSDCTMTLTMGDGSTYDGVFAPDGNTSDWMATVNGIVLSGTLKRIGH
jgi:hypothetical protein